MANIQTAAAAFQAGNYVDSERICRELLGNNPRDARALVLLGMTLGNGGRVGEGIDALLAAAKWNPNVLPIYANLAILLARAERFQEAASAYRSALALAPGNAELRAGYAQALTNRGFQLQAIGAFEKARSLFEESIRIEPKQGMAYASIARGQKLGPGDRPLVELLERVLLEGLLTGMDLACLHFAIGKAREDAGLYEEAMNLYDEANRLAFEASPTTRSFPPEIYRNSLMRMAGLFDGATSAELTVDKAEGPQPIFVLGVMRSGTTLVEQILSNHPEVSAAGELEFWMRHGSETIRSSGGTITRDLVLKLRDDYLQLIRSRADGALWVTDKMPQNYQWIGLIQLAFPSAPIIHLGRNRLDTALSIWTTPYEQPPDFVHNKANIMTMMSVHGELMEHWRKVTPPGRILDVRYEDLVLNAETVTRQMVAFCGLTWDERCLRPEENKRPVHTASFWQARQPVYASSISRWQKFEPWLGEFRELQ